MIIALCQIDTTVGDFAGNCAKIADFAARARRDGAHLAVFPELAVCGYPPEDLLMRESFLAVHDKALEDLAAHVPPDLPMLMGCLSRNEGDGRPLHNAVALVDDGIARIVARKTLLPTYDVFDESRYFESWSSPSENIIEISARGGEMQRLGIVICEDSWNDAQFFDQRRYAIDPVEELVNVGVDAVINLSASPWAAGRQTFRAEMLQAAAKRHGVPMLCCNLVGGDVSLQFDGSSVAMKATGAAFAPVAFAEGMYLVDLKAEWTEQVKTKPLVDMHIEAVTQGIRAYSTKFGFPKAVIGLSGGIDSAVVAALAVDALGGENVLGVAMPSHHSSDHSVNDARELADNLGMEFRELPIGGLQDAFASALEEPFAGTKSGLAEENLQSRARGVLLMALSNKFGPLLLTTGNKSECSVGYATLYGDMCGAIAPIADLWKTEVYAVAQRINRDGDRIPDSTMTKPPSAELRPDQKDTDSLPPYDVLDPVLKCLVEQELSVEATAEKTGMPESEVRELLRMVMRNEFKRFQYPPTLRLSDRSWAGRRMPVAHRFYE